MFVPSEELCKNIIWGCIEHIQLQIAEETGIVTKENDILDLWDINGKAMRKVLTKQINSVLADMQEAGIDHSLDKGVDYFIEFIDSSKQFRPGIRHQFIEMLQVPKANLDGAMQQLALELYAYLKDRNSDFVRIEDDGTMYIDCTPHINF